MKGRRDELLTHAVAHASWLLTRNREMYPLAFVCTAERGPDQVATAMADEKASVAGYLHALERAVRLVVDSSSPAITLVALVRHVTLTDTVTGAQADAISVHIEGRGDRVATLCFLRIRWVDGVLELDDPNAQEEPLRFFGERAQ